LGDNGAIRASVRISELQPAAECPACGSGPLYEINEPGALIGFVGNACVRSTIYELQKLCGWRGAKELTADPPAEAGSWRYDPPMGSLIGMLRYEQGFPFHRLAQTQDQLKVPSAAPTRWEIVSLATET
jgi:hypothetical protein